MRSQAVPRSLQLLPCPNTFEEADWVLPICHELEKGPHLRVEVQRELYEYSRAAPLTLAEFVMVFEFVPLAKGVTEFCEAQAERRLREEGVKDVPN